MRVLVTGASGMLGGTVARRLLARGDQVRVFQRRPAAIAGTDDQHVAGIAVGEQGHVRQHFLIYELVGFGNLNGAVQHQHPAE